MSKSENQELNPWYMYFNPCGIEPVNGYVYQTCNAAGCHRFQCLAKTAYLMAEYVLRDGTSVDNEKAEFADHLRTELLGEAVVALSGATTRVNRQNIEPIAGEVAKKAQAIIDEMALCERMSTPLTEDFLAQCTDAQREVMNRMASKAFELENFRGNRTEAMGDVQEMKEIVQQALDQGLEDIGLIARYAIGFGLGEKVPQYTMSQIFKHPGVEKLKERP